MGGSGGSGGGASLLLRRGSARKCTLPPVDERAGGQERPRQPPPWSSMCPPRRCPCALPRPVTGVGSGREGGGRRMADSGMRASLVPALASTGLVGPPKGSGRGEVSGPALDWQAVGTEKKPTMANGKARKGLSSKPLGCHHDLTTTRGKRTRKHVLFVGGRDVTRRTDGRRSSAVASRGRHDALTRQTLARSLLAIAGCYSSVGVSHTLRGKIAFVHPLGAVLAWCSAVLVDTLGLALATPNTGSSSAEGRGPNDRRHFGDQKAGWWWLLLMFGWW